MTARWYRTGVIYSLDVRLFQDSDGDGIGDLCGLTSRLDHLSRLGVSILWLNPIHPTPYRDGGYDVTDYYGVDESLGSDTEPYRDGESDKELVPIHAEALLE